MDVVVDFDKEEFNFLPKNFVNGREVFPKSFYVVSTIIRNDTIYKNLGLLHQEKINITNTRCTRSEIMKYSEIQLISIPIDIFCRSCYKG